MGTSISLTRWKWGWDKSLIPVGFRYEDGDNFFFMGMGMRLWNSSRPHPLPSLNTTSLSISFNLVLRSSLHLSFLFFSFLVLTSKALTSLNSWSPPPSITFFRHKLLVTSSSPFVVSFWLELFNAISSSIYKVTSLFWWLIVFWVIL